ncbi:hypothetical protein D0A37_08605 [Microcoleus vaginatus HSN003]|nr:hypothetical protein D0A37_08605 [Microcoleus vaginatus HSN003]
MTSRIRLKERDSKSPDFPEVLAPSQVPRLRQSWEKESFNGKLKRLWRLKVCDTGNAIPRIEVRKGEISSLLPRSQSAMMSDAAASAAATRI